MSRLRSRALPADLVAPPEPEPVLPAGERWADIIYHLRKPHEGGYCEVSQAMLAELLDVGLSTLKAWERGTSVPHGAVVTACARCRGLSPRRCHAAAARSRTILRAGMVADAQEKCR